MATRGGYSEMSQFAPHPPEDIEMRNIIDKLANFVARNGPEFEQMTQEKQRDNPKFFFLFGGEFNAYYRWKVTSEQAALYSQHQPSQPQSRPIPSLMAQPQYGHQQAPFPSLPSSYSQPNFSQRPPYQPPQSYSQSQALYSQPQPSCSQPQPPCSQPQPLMNQDPAPPITSTNTPAQPTPPWLQKQQQQAQKGVVQQLKQMKLQEQAALQQHGINDPLEIEFSAVVRPIMESCTKDSIAAGKSWIFTHSKTVEECQQVARFILRKTLNSAGIGFSQKLHMIYLINDVIHHCLRKGAQELKQAIEEVVVQIFYNVHDGNPDKSDSLMKVLKIWETQRYFSEVALQQIRAIVTEESEESALPPADAAPPPAPESQPLPPWQKQQQGRFPQQPGSMFSQPHPPMQPPWQQQQAPPPWQQAFNAPPPPPWVQNAGAPPPWQQPQPPVGKPTPLFPPQHDEPPPPPPPPSHQPSQLHGEEGEGREGAERQREGSGRNTPVNQMEVKVEDDVRADRAPSEDLPEENEEDDFQPGQTQTFDYNHRSRPAHDTAIEENAEKEDIGGFREREEDVGGFRKREVFDYNHQHLPWDMGPSLHPDMGPLPPFPPHPRWGPLPPHLPPPDLPPPDLPPPDLPPPIPYFDLPAGLMVAIVPLHEHSYRPLNPMDVRLPPPQPPTERLLKAVERFYTPASEDRPRNADGWEARALLHFFDAKRNAKEAMMNRYRPPRRLPPRRRRSYSRSRSRSRSRSPYRRRRRRYITSRDGFYQAFSSSQYCKQKTLGSRSYSRSRSHSYSRSRSRSYSRSRSRSRSPRYRRRRSSRSPSTKSRSRSRSKSRSRSRSPPYRRRRSRSPFIPTVRSPRRSPSPDRPFFQPESAHLDRRLAESNRGHQLLRKMGWEGAGLGSEEQGIQEPIKGGEVRDKQDKYKGVGMDLSDPFEQFRKNKSYTFNRRTSSAATR